ncbi:4-hydroxy-3-methylbut-2-en-1-yl diphosphate synthase [uncultured Paludibacter sp.]|nr:4-hydroxy-3-methylbut-2-en-1-yl diphosphate synthase [uncultured Paludibacter sp.]
MNLYNYSRRKSDEVKIGNLLMGGKNPIRVQSMANTNTNDIENSVAQCLRIVDAGGELVRFTTQGIKEADSLHIIHDEIRRRDCDVPLVADVHFNANVADYTAAFLEKVRVNPGNYVSGIKNDGTNYTDEEYRQEFDKIKQRFVPFLNICKENNTAIRVGVNHGSLSERMLNRWGNTAEGMVESSLEFQRICKEQNFKNVVLSMKASNTVMMIEAVRLLVKKMEAENLHFPIHLGVTEAGDGEDGRIKSAVGIGGLLAEGIGDTIRVSLSEEPEAEIPVAKLLRDYISERENHSEIKLKSENKVEKKVFERRKTTQVKNIGGNSLPIVISYPNNHSTLKSDYIIDNNKIIDEQGNVFSIQSVASLINTTLLNEEIQFVKMNYDELNSVVIEKLKKTPRVVLLIESNHKNPVGEIRAFIHTLIAEACETPVILVGKYNEDNLETLQVKASADLGIMFVDGLADGILIENRGKISENDMLSLSFGILQAARVRTSKTEFISCPGCGRTMFNLQSVIARIKSRTSHLTGLKIGIMGCVVNGPGEMADADYGYVGAGRGKVSLYKKHECIEKNIPEDEALDKLIELIKINNDWKDN